MVLFEHNNTIYMGDDMINSLANPIQFEYHDLRIHLHPKLYYPNKNNAQPITFLDKNSILVDYDVVLLCIDVRKLTKYEVENCEQISLTSKFDWGPYGKGGGVSKVESHSNYIELVL